MVQTHTFHLSPRPAPFCINGGREARCRCRQGLRIQGLCGEERAAGSMRQNAEMAFCLPLFLYKRGARENQSPDNRCLPISYMGIKNRHPLRDDDFDMISFHRINQR